MTVIQGRPSGIGTWRSAGCEMISQSFGEENEIVVKWTQNRVSAHDFDVSIFKVECIMMSSYPFAATFIDVLTQFGWGQVGDSRNTKCRGDCGNWDIDKGLGGIFHTLETGRYNSSQDRRRGINASVIGGEILGNESNSCFNLCCSLRFGNNCSVVR